MARLQVTGPGVTNNNDDVALLLAQAVDKNITQKPTYQWP